MTVNISWTEQFSFDFDIDKFITNYKLNDRSTYQKVYSCLEDYKNGYDDFSPEYMAGEKVYKKITELVLNRLQGITSGYNDINMGLINIPKQQLSNQSFCPNNCSNCPSDKKRICDSDYIEE